MALTSFNVNDTIAKALHEPETYDNRITRAQLHLSDQWKVLGRTLNDSIPEYDDEFPDIPLMMRGGGEYDGNVVIHVAWNNRGTFRCPKCGHRCSEILSYETRYYRHLDDMNHRCFIHVELPKYRCGCGSDPQHRFPMVEPRLRYTREFSMEVVRRLKDGTRSAVAKGLDISRDIVSGILRRVVHRGIMAQDLSPVTGVYVDETQFGHGQDYISVFLDQNHKAIYVCEGHGKDVLGMFRTNLIVQGGDPENIRFFSADMSRAYEAGVLGMFPNATLVWDRFHLMKAVNEALNDIRKGVVRKDGDTPLRLIKYTLLHRRSVMSRKHVERLRAIRMSSPELALAFDMKETFAEIIKVRDPTAMERALRIWAEWVMSDGPKEFRKKAEMFLGKIDRIVAWTRFPVSNSVCEGINKNIQDIRRSACGYRNHDNFYDMIFLRMGDLQLTF